MCNGQPAEESIRLVCPVCWVGSIRFVWFCWHVWLLDYGWWTICSVSVYQACIYSYYRLSYCNQTIVVTDHTSRIRSHRCFCWVSCQSDSLLRQVTGQAESRSLLFVVGSLRSPSEAYDTSCRMRSKFEKLTFGFEDPTQRLNYWTRWQASWNSNSGSIS